MSELYPLKFEPILKEKVWGGSALAERYNKKTDSRSVGESWELSAVQGDLSVVSNGYLAGNNIEELIEVYMGDLTGDMVYDKFGNEFPLLIKLIEARQDLSIQVHPDDNLAKTRHQAYGKTEMWYILESDKGARIYSGFRKGVTKLIYQEAVKSGKVPDLLNAEPAEPGDAFFTPAGRVHAIGSGIILAEIQQTSDITYRIFDWDRDSQGKGGRELHTDLALDCIDFRPAGEIRIHKEPGPGETVNLVSCEYFNTNIIYLDSAIRKEFYTVDSFVVYICTAGECLIRWDDNYEVITKGETVLLPAMIKEIILEPVKVSHLLEIYIVHDISN
jgi:mannose-6-phosphate isomerase